MFACGLRGAFKPFFVWAVPPLPAVLLTSSGLPLKVISSQVWYYLVKYQGYLRVWYNSLGAHILVPEKKPHLLPLKKPNL